MAGRNNDEKIRCSFCGKSQDQVRKLIAGPNGAYICDECVDICSEIIEEELDENDVPEETEAQEINLIKPEEMKAFLDDYVIGQEQAKKCFLLRYTIIIRGSRRRRMTVWSCRRVIS